MGAIKQSPTLSAVSASTQPTIRRRSIDSALAPSSSDLQKLLGSPRVASSEAMSLLRHNYSRYRRRSFDELEPVPPGWPALELNTPSSLSSTVHQAPGQGARRRRAAAAVFLAALGLVFPFIFKFNVVGKIEIDRRRPLLTDDYAYVIVTYHKAGPKLSHTLAGYMEQHLFNSDDSKLLKRVHPHKPDKSCDELSLYPGTITIIESPDFDCDEFTLENMLMHNTDPGARGKAGVKIIHLVRNPFTMAVSNYFYHRHDPTPEPFVHQIDPCRPRQYRVVESYEDGVVLSREDYDTVVSVCHTLYQTMPGLKNATYHEHLRTLDLIDGLRIATANEFHSLATMANDLVAFRRLRGRSEGPKIATMTIDDWITRPGNSMYAFLSFLFPNNSNGDAKYFMPEHKKNSMAEMYETDYHEKAKTWDHITFGKNSEALELIEGLRRDAALGVLLGKIELLLDGVVEEERSEQRFAEREWYHSIPD